MTQHELQAFHVMAKPTGAQCNLDCKYCFFLSKEALYPNDKFRMSDGVMEAYIRQTIEAHRTPEITIAWQGGEPTLMGLDFFRRAMDVEKRYRKPGTTIKNTLQTNGTKLDDAWCEFFREHNFLIGISLDGTREMHDAYRVDKGGRGSFDQVMRGLWLLQKHGVEFNVLCTVHAGNGDRPLELYRFVRDEVKAQYLQFIPIIERATAETIDAANRGWGEGNRARPLYLQRGSLVTERSVKPEQWGRFLIAIFDEWVRRDVGKMFVQLFDASLVSWMRGYSSICIFRPTCGDGVALEHNGDVYSCDHFVEPGHLLGNIMEDPLGAMVGSEQQKKFGRDKQDTLPAYCRSCEVKFACNGECPKNRFLTAPDGEEGLNYLCAGYKAFFMHVDRPMKLMAGLLQRGRYAEEVMGVLAAEESRLLEAVAQAGRNDPCPCGSGRKVKKCHLEMAEARPLRSSVGT